jgi:transposase InsO family protein
VVKINKQSTIKFIKSIVYRFGVPNRIITDNGSQFISSTFQGYCEDLGIQIFYASIDHLESNGQVERANAEILKGLKTLWANRTSSSRATGETPFFLVYETEAVIPPEITVVSTRVRHMTKPHRTSFDMMMSTLSTNEDGKQLFEMHGTARRSSATTSGLCIVGSSRWMMWCFGAYFLVKA